MKTLEMRENHRKKWGRIYKYTPISAAINNTFPNLVPYQSLFNFVLFCYLVSKLFNLKRGMHVNKTIRNKSKTCRIIKGGTYKSYIISAANCPRVLNLEPNLC